MSLATDKLNLLNEKFEYILADIAYDFYKLLKITRYCDNKEDLIEKLDCQAYTSALSGKFCDYVGNSGGGFGSW